MEKSKKKNIIALAVTMVLVIAVLAFLQQLFMPKYMSEIYEGAMIREYYDSNKNHNIIFVGDCEIYENISPITLYEKYGLTSYMRGSSQQLIWQSYYLLEETLKYEKPDVVVFNVLSMKYSEPQNEAYNRMSLDGMKWSMSKIKSVKASMTEEESFLSYVFPLLRYHSRWNDVKAEDFKYLFHRDKKTIAGYLMRADVKPVTGTAIMGNPDNDDFAQIDYDYLDKMRDICKKNDIQLVLIKAPSIFPFWYDEWNENIIKYAEKNDLLYINFLDEDILKDIGIDYSKDTYDAGLHLNVYGAEKLADYFGKILVDKFTFKDYTSNEKTAAEWNQLVEDYNKELKAQLDYIEKNGSLKGY